MATCQETNGKLDDKRESRRKEVMLGELPQDFLRVVPMTENQQLSVDEQIAFGLQQQLTSYEITSIMYGRLDIDILEGKLNKNYGLTRMDPYVRLKVGHAVYETKTAYNGAKNPIWNAFFKSFFYQETNCVKIEVFDERQFTLDEKIAWTYYTFPDSLFEGQNVDEWIPLNGKLGDGKEGTIHLRLGYKPPPDESAVINSFVALEPKSGDYVEMKSDFAEQTVSPNSKVTILDFEQVKEMFPNIAVGVIRKVMEGNNGNQEQSINTLLELNADTVMVYKQKDDFPSPNI